MVFISLLALLVLCIVFSWTTRGAMAFSERQNARLRKDEQSLVDLQPWQTAQALAPLAVTAEENEYAREAERLADHEVDQAFAAALRQARLDAQHRTLTGDALALSQKVSQLEQLKQQDQALVDSLTAKSESLKAPAMTAQQASRTSDDLEVAKAQLGLDSDELADAQQRSGARFRGSQHTDPGRTVCARSLNAQVRQRGREGGGQIAVLSAAQNQTLAARIECMVQQSKRQELIEQALQEAQNNVHSLTAEHNALEAKANAAAAGGAAPDRATQLANLKNRSIERQILSIDDDRIQTEQQLAHRIRKWEAQVKLQHQIVAASDSAVA